MSFVAQYPGPCANDCDGIRPGDLVEYVGALLPYRHVGECPEPADDLAVTQAPCGGCFQVPAANGTCGCDE